MITEIWVWYDERGDVPLFIKAGEVASMFEATFVNFYSWREVHEWGGIITCPGILVRPRCPSDWTRIRVKLALRGHPGVEWVEVKTRDMDGMVRKMPLDLREDS